MTFQQQINLQENDIEKVLKEILDQWNKVQATIESKVKDDTDIDTKLAKLLENQKIATIVQRVYTEDELRIKQKILEQYSQLSGDEEDYDDDDDDKATASASTSDGLTKNTNAHDVAQLVKERREQAKADSQNKKLKDKEDREKQKQNKIDKKESRKTVKGEKRR